MDIDILKEKSLMLVLAYAPAGLGHLRVTEALYHGLPKETTSLLLGSQDKSVGYLHRYMSIHPLSRSIMEWMQRGTPENLFTGFYRWFLRSGSKLLYRQIITLLDQRINPPKTILMVATHFGLAHQLAAIKNTIESERKLKIILVVQVTDDSPQHVWYVNGADLIVVPSEKTKEELIRYGEKAGLPKVDFTVIPYPISPQFIKTLSEDKYKARIDQLDKDSKTVTNIAIPISGAAIGTAFFTVMIDTLIKKSDRFKFHVITKNAFYTKLFINQMLERPCINLHASVFDRGVVEKYEEVYHDNIIALEVTKPSEQAFKTFISTNLVGGSVLLFAHPVGRQEYDNLDFLRRHKLICTKTQQKYLWEKSLRGLSLDSSEDKQLLSEAKNWRGIFLPNNPKESADFIWWCLEQKILKQMALCHVLPHKDDENKNEISDNGVEIFWDKVANLLEEKIL